MIDAESDDSQGGQDRGDIVMAELVHPGGRMLVWGVAAALIGAFFVVDVVFPSRCIDGRGRQMADCRLDGHPHRPGESDCPLGIVSAGEYRTSRLLVSVADDGDVVRTDLGQSAALARHLRTDMIRSDAILLIIVLLAGVAILQVPLWIAKKLFRWRLTRQPGDTEASLQEDRQFHLQHLLIAAVFLAVALSPLHQVLPPARGDSLISIATCSCCCRP